MHPELLHIGSWTLRTYSVVTEIGIVVGVIAGYVAARRQGVRGETFFDIAIWTVIAGIVGSRLYYVVVNWELERFYEEPIRILYSWEGGLIFQGAILGSVFALFALARLRKVPFLLIADIGALGLPLGHTIGRFACFFQGCCYGVPTDLPWGVQFPNLSEPVHPTMIYESIANFVIFLVLWHFDKRKRFLGLTFSLYLILYSSARFLNEFLRGDPADVVLGLRVAQWVCLGTIVLGVVLAVSLWLHAANARRAAKEEIYPSQP